MKISVTDTGSGIIHQFARSLGAKVDGRFIRIPKSRGAGYITGFAWGPDLRMMIRNYYLHQDVLIERTNELKEGQEDVIFLLSGVLPSVEPGAGIRAEPPNIMICRQSVSSIMSMPARTSFGSVTIAVSRKHLEQLFGDLDHPVVASVLSARENFVYETGVSREILDTAAGFLVQPVPEALAGRFYQSKCEELLCYVFAILLKREAVASTSMHLDDIRAIYAVKTQLISALDQPPDIAGLARQAAMSEPKLRKLFRQTFGMGVFEYYQSKRMEQAALMLKDGRKSVSEVGYELGFTNLSHFARVFEQQFGMKPKKFSMGLA